MSKKKPTKSNKKNKNKDKKVEPIDEFTEMDMETLTNEINILQQKLNDVKVRRNYIQNEKDMINGFYDNTRNEVEDIESQIRLKDTNMERKEEEHRTEVKVYMQKVQHLEYDMKVSAQQVQEHGLGMLKEEEEQHEVRDNDRKLLKVSLKKSIRDKNLQSINDVNKLHQAHEKSMKMMKKNFQDELKQLETKYERKYKDLKEDLELRLKVEIHEIEERKNQHRNDLTKNHEEAFRNLKAYYNSITKNNLDLIRQQREELKKLENEMMQRQKAIDSYRIQNNTLREPLEREKEELAQLQAKLQNFAKDQMSLRNAKNRVIVLKDKYEKLKADKNNMDHQLQIASKERDELYQKFEAVCAQIKDMTNYKNAYIERKHQVLEQNLQAKQTQLEEVTKRAELDQNYVTDLNTKIEESLESKNAILKNLKYSLAHATKAYNDAIRVYEAKLVEFGIPAEELGFQPIETNTSTMPAGLVAA